MRCTTKGTLRLAADLQVLGKKNICIGTVRVRYSSRGKAIATRTAKLSKACTYRLTTTFKASRKQRAVLRVQSDLIRTQRFTNAEKKGAAASQKLLFPLIFFIMPAVFIMIFGPVILGLLGGGK